MATHHDNDMNMNHMSTDHHTAWRCRSPMRN
jgi:hypothetical protein